MERRLFAAGAQAMSNYTRWRLYGNKRYVVRKFVLSRNAEGVVGEDEREPKRQRVKQ